MKIPTPEEQKRAILRVLLDLVKKAGQSVIEAEKDLAVSEVHQKYKKKELDECYGGGFSQQNPYDEQVKRYQVGLEAAKENKIYWETIYDYALNTIFK